MELLKNAGLFALLTLMLDLVPLAMGVWYVIGPSEQRLALMRPLSLVGLFAALTGGVLGFLIVLRNIGVSQDFSPDAFRRMAIGASESLVSMFVGFACLTVAWLLVAIGMARQDRRL